MVVELEHVLFDNLFQNIDDKKNTSVTWNIITAHFPLHFSNQIADTWSCYLLSVKDIIYIQGDMC